MESLQRQTFGDFEVLAVDDGSTDETLVLLDDWAADDPRVRVLRSRRRGLVPALALALDNAHGDLIARMDADDVAEPTRLDRQVRHLTDQRDLAACGTGVRYFPRQVVRGGARRYEAWINSLHTHEEIERDIFIECPVAHPTLAARRRVLTAVGGYRDMGWPEDYDLVLRLWAAGHRLENLPQVLYHWREREDRTSRVDPIYSPARFRQVKVHFLRKTLLAADRLAIIVGAGPVGKSFARELAAAGSRTIAFVDVDPRKVGQEIYGAPVIDLDDLTHLAGPRSAHRALVLAAVGQPGAREDIREGCRQLGLVEGKDFIAVA